MTAPASTPASAIASSGELRAQGPAGVRLDELEGGRLLALGPFAGGDLGGVVLLAAHVRVSGAAAREPLAVRWWAIADRGGDPPRPLEPLGRLELRTTTGVVLVLTPDPIGPGVERRYVLTAAPAGPPGAAVLDVADAFGVLASAAELEALAGGGLEALLGAVVGKAAP